MQASIKNRTIFCHDNLPVLRGIDSESIDLIYLDPPFNKGREFHAPIGSTAEGGEFKDIWSEDDVKEEWHNQISDKHPSLYKYLDAVGDIGSRSAKYYLIYMAVRLIEMYRVLKSTGSIYLHCDPTASHYLKLLMDTIWGHSYFANEVTWRRATSHNDPKKWGNIADQILFYAKGDSYTWNTDDVRTPSTTVYASHDELGLYRVGDLTGPGTSAGESGEVWRSYNITSRGRCWSAPKTGHYAKWISENVIEGYAQIPGVLARLDALDEAGLIHHPKKPGGWPGLKRYAVADLGTPPQNIILDCPGFTNFNKGFQGKEFLNYPTQKPLSLLQKIVKVSSNDGDVVLDPFCGCATTCVAAEQLGRKWIGIDVSSMAYDLVKDRLRDQVVEDNTKGMQRNRVPDLFVKPIFREDIPSRTDISGKKKPTKEDKQQLFGKQNGCCAGCETKFDIQHLEIDHIVPQSEGGWHEIENLQLLCGQCNRIKGDRPMEYLQVRLKAIYGKRSP